MKVKVIKASPTAWSADFIGKIFEVENHHEHEDFYVLSDDILNDDEKRLLKKENCELLNSELNVQGDQGTKS